MSLPVGTLVLCVSGRNVGQVGEVVSPLELHRTWSALEGALQYGVRFPAVPSGWPGGQGLPRDAWCVRPHEIVPITPPGDAIDVPRENPVEVAA